MGEQSLPIHIFANLFLHVYRKMSNVLSLESSHREDSIIDFTSLRIVQKVSKLALNRFLCLFYMLDYFSPCSIKNGVSGPTCATSA